MKGGPHRTARLLLGWGLAFGLMALLPLLMLGAYGVMEYFGLVSVRSALVLSGLFVVVFSAGMVVSGWFIFRALVPKADELARTAGRDATAEVVSVERTRWRSGGHLNFKLEEVPRRREHRIFVRVSLPGEPPYDAEIAEFLRGEEAPGPGDILNVRVHPKRRDVVVRVTPRDAGAAATQASRQASADKLST